MILYDFINPNTKQSYYFGQDYNMIYNNCLYKIDGGYHWRDPVIEQRIAITNETNLEPTDALEMIAIEQNYLRFAKVANLGDLINFEEYKKRYRQYNP